MGKKSRRQRAKDPVTEARKALKDAAGDTPLRNLSPQELRKLANEVLDSQDPTRADDDDDDDDSELDRNLDAVQDAVWAASKPTVAEAEAAYRAAMRETPAGHWKKSEKLKLALAATALQNALTTDENDRKNFEAYMGIVAPSICADETLLKAMKRWPRIRKYWPRVRRRICWGCGKQYDLSEPRLWVCSGCDDARYCDEACQAAHWPDHRRKCYETFKRRIHTQVSEGAQKPEMLQEFGELLDVFGDYVQ